MFSIALNSIIILVICMILGFIARKRNLITKAGEPVLSSILLSVTLPSTIIMSMQRDFNRELFNSSMIVLVASFLIHFAGFFLGLLLFKVLRGKSYEKGVWVFSLVFSNLVYMGLPLIESIYGSMGVFYASICTISFNFLAFTLGVKIMIKGSNCSVEEKDTIKKIFFNVPIWATIIGFLMFTFSIRLPDVVGSALSSVGSMTTPLSMIIIGSILATNNLKTVFLGAKMYIMIFVRLVAFPILAFFVLRIFIADEVIVGVLTIATAMPAAVLTAIFAAKYECNRDLASKFVFISTVLSVITIPLIALLI
ncbi:MAG: AEC family transporter [Defluviitaleaceae bacterium]|nr:AEC family transporter [Defluviitaleaceae bacterium]